MRFRPPTPSGVAIGVALVVVLTAGAAAGQALITSADIKDGTIQSVDIKTGTIASGDIKDGTVTSGDIKNETVASGDIKNGTIAGGDLKNGAVNSSKVADNSLTAADIKANGVGSSELAANAVNSAKVADNSLTAADLAANSVGTSEIVNGSVAEADVDPDLLANLGGFDGPNWGIVDRNVIGNGDSYLRAGPIAGPQGGAAPPLGVGSLGLRTGSGEDKAAFGNQVDFIGVSFLDITSLSYWVFTTVENNDFVPNMPDLQFEIDPNLVAAGPLENFSTLINEHENTLPGWTLIDTTQEGEWWLTGNSGTITGCDQAGPCTWDELLIALEDGDDDPPIILTVQFNKGRNNPFSGAVDALTINDTTYDFEPTGVTETPAG